MGEFVAILHFENYYKLKRTSGKKPPLLKNVLSQQNMLAPITFVGPLKADMLSDSAFHGDARFNFILQGVVYYKENTLLIFAVKIW